LTYVKYGRVKRKDAVISVKSLFAAGELERDDFEPVECRCILLRTFLSLGTFSRL
jgi:hypothetical protein